MRQALGGLVLAAAALSAGVASPPVAPPVLDVDPGDPVCATERAAPRCSLLAALQAANAAGNGVVRLAPGSVHILDEGVAVNGQEGRSGLPSITGDVLIEGNGAVVERNTAAGTPAFRIFHVAPQGRLRLRDLTIRNGATEINTDGAGLWNTGTLELERVTVTGNHAGDDGGGIRNDGTLKLLDSVIVGNRANGDGGVGGGLYNLPVRGAGEAMVAGSVFRDNHAGDRGGALWNSGTVSLEDTILERNSAGGQGGGVCTTGPVSLLRCRIVSNQAGGRAGGISALGPVEAVESTISENAAPVEPDHEGQVTVRKEAAVH